jgi:hypothetical protein
MIHLLYSFNISQPGEKVKDGKTRPKDTTSAFVMPYIRGVVPEVEKAREERRRADLEPALDLATDELREVSASIEKLFWGQPLSRLMPRAASTWWIAVATAFRYTAGSRVNRWGTSRGGGKMRLKFLFAHRDERVSCHRRRFPPAREAPAHTLVFVKRAWIMHCWTMRNTMPQELP